MGLKLYEESDIQDIADAIRSKNGSSSTYKVSDMAAAISAISGGLEYETGSFTPTSDSTISGTTIYFTNTHTSPPCLVLFVDDASNNIAVDASNSAVFMAYWSYYDAFNHAYYYNPNTSTSTKIYAQGYSGTRSSNGNISNGTYQVTNTSQNEYVTSSYFKVSLFFGGYTRAGRTYRWLAVWPPAA